MLLLCLQVLLGGESDMLMCDAQSGYNYGAGLVAEMKKQGLTDDEILKVKVSHRDWRGCKRGFNV